MSDFIESPTDGTPPEVPAPAGPMQNMPNTWAYLTRNARPTGESLDAAIAQIEGKMGTPEYLKNEAMQDRLKGLYERRDGSGDDADAAVKPSPAETRTGQGRELGMDWGDGQRTPLGDDDAVLDAGDFDAKNFFDWMPTDIEVSHADRPIIQSFAEHMQGHSMTPTQVHEAIRFANEFEGDNLAEDFAAHMQPHGVTVAQAQEAHKWFTEYMSSEAAKDDAAVAKVDQFIADVEALMGSPEYLKNEQLQSDYKRVIAIRDGDGDE